MSNSENICTIYQYANKCKISATAVYLRIAKGDIIPVFIGKTMFINLDTTPIKGRAQGRKSAESILSQK